MRYFCFILFLCLLACSNDDYLEEKVKNSVEEVTINSPVNQYKQLLPYYKKYGSIGSGILKAERNFWSGSNIIEFADENNETITVKFDTQNANILINRVCNGCLDENLFQVRAADGDYGMLLIDAKLSNEKVLASIGTKWYKISQGDMTYIPWSDFLLNKYIYTQSKPIYIYSQPSLDSTKHLYEGDSLLIYDVQQDWAKVKICSDEECGSCNSESNGWIIWRNSDQLKIDLRYMC